MLNNAKIASEYEFDGDVSASESLCRKTLHAVNILHDTLQFNMEDFTATNLYEWQGYITIISEFCESVVAGNYITCECEEYVRCLISIFDISFLTLLFDHRRLLLSRIQETEIDCYNEETLVCWVDDLLVQIINVIEVAASRHVQATSLVGEIPIGLQRQREEAQLRGVSQLPHKLSALPSILGSYYASPLVKRLALLILFATFVIRPDLEDNCDPWAESGLNVHHFLELLDQYLNQLVNDIQEAYWTGTETVLVLQHRLSYAALISLYVTVDRFARGHENNNGQVFRPYTMSCLLDLVSVVLDYNDYEPPSAIGVLNPAQTILLKWGGIVPWAWAQWNDSCILKFTVLIKLTSTWFIHLAEILSISPWERNKQCDNERVYYICPLLSNTLRVAIETEPNASLIALFHQVVRTNDEGFPIGDHDLIRLHRVSWCLAELVMRHGNSLSPDVLFYVAERLLHLLRSWKVTIGEVKVKYECIRCLNVIDKTITSKALETLVGNKDDVFFQELENEMKRLMGYCSTTYIRELTLLFTSPEESLNLLALLDLLTLMCKCGQSKHLPKSTITFLVQFVAVASSPVSEFCASIDLRVSLLSCLTELRPQKSTELGVATLCQHKEWNEGNVVGLVLGIRRGYPHLASVFASYIKISINKKTDKLVVAEAWDYLRDVLIMIASGQLTLSLENQYSLSLSPSLSQVAERICDALKVLLVRSDISIVRYLLGSPWTLSLVDTLKRATPTQFSQSDEDANQLSSIFDGFLKKMHEMETKLRDKEQRSTELPTKK